VDLAASRFIDSTEIGSDKRQLVGWIRGPVPHGTSSQDLHEAAKRLYEKGTSDWIFKTREWRDWIGFNKRAIWLYGIPGAGKTVLASLVVDKLQGLRAKDNKRLCSYYYCYHGHNQDESGPFLRSIVSELLSAQPEDQVSEEIWDSFQRDSPLNQQLLLDILEQLLHRWNRFYVVIDALDESQYWGHLISLLEILTSEGRFCKIQLFATSRQYDDIRARMSRMSQPLSMCNSFVEADIRIFVAARIKGEPKFHRWPEDLRSEVEQVLTVGAKGMFRWAAGQIDILRRLHHQSKIRAAIKTLPRDLDETYKRIFSLIAPEEHDLVRHALHLVCFHDWLWGGKTPLLSQLILDSYSIFQEDTDHTDDPNDVMYDLETLKDACGCLITFRNTPSETAIIAHYTVREFLESSRTAGPLTDWVKINPTNRYPSLLSAAFQVTLASKTSVMSHARCYSGSTNWSSLREYCLASSVRSLTTNEEVVKPDLAFQLVDPSAPHYQVMEAVLTQNSWWLKSDLLHDNRIPLPFWSISWAVDGKSCPAAILTNLLIMECKMLAEAFMLHLGPQAQRLLQDAVRGEILPRNSWYEYGLESCAQFQGNLLHVLAQLHHLSTTNFSLVQNGVGITNDTHDIMPFLMTCYGYDPKINHQKANYRNISSQLHPDDRFSIVNQLLQSGACADPAGYQVTPLQIACNRRSLRSVKALLEAGADPNGVGDPEGVGWHDKQSLLHPFSKLHGTLPFDILDRFHPMFNFREVMLLDGTELGEVKGAFTEEIRRVLVSYGARSSREQTGGSLPIRGKE